MIVVVVSAATSIPVFGLFRRALLPAGGEHLRDPRWYGIVLVLSSADSKEPLVKPTNKQWIGLTFTFLIACLVWLQNVFVFQGDAEKQGGLGWF